MKLFFGFLFFFSALFYSQSNTELLKTLTKEISQKKMYSDKKEAAIEDLKRNKSQNPNQEYINNENIYRLYKQYQIDSAVHYVKKNMAISEQLNNLKMKAESSLQLAHLYSTLGKYKESERLLKSINKNALDSETKANYYDTYSKFFEHYTTNINDVNGIKNIELYRDSLLMVLPTSGVQYKINLSQKFIHEGKLDNAEKLLHNLINIAKKKNLDYAMSAYLLGDVYKLKNKKDEELKYYLISAITDTQNAIKDNASYQNLALIFYHNGDIDNAYLFTKSAIEDAIFCNVKFRTLNISEMYSIINKAYVDKETKSKSQLKLYLIFISLLSVILVGLIIYIYRQMKKVTRIKEQLSKTTEQLELSNSEITKTNEKLQLLNHQLSESNLIKEEYIAYFFDTCSSYINKLEDYRKNLNKKAKDNQLDELFKTLRSNTLIENELEELYRNFDQIFLNLYPSFVTDFNSLLIPEEKIVLKKGELLNTELRIFALIRLGITDSVKIAAFLRYSLSTIYNYRTKTRNKAAESRDLFENRVANIGEIASK
ncbi:DUF6377 domain-containing protein [Chryseobacterium sp. CBo1]|uniref:DUF6377 domain-containing protein n=1 Tax=Chryseobacterium sp. CBo1 TaxID=1869230 RepID=UPI000A8BE05B|nr:DUF6377 domain-containing protein [Chryseobacterium sp. CBo1]